MNQGEKEALLESGESVFDLLNARDELAHIRTILAAAVPQPESVECPDCCNGAIQSESSLNIRSMRCRRCSGTGRIPAPERTTLEMAEAVVADRDYCKQQAEDAERQLANIKRQVVDPGSLQGMRIGYNDVSNRFCVHDAEGNFLWSGEATFNAWQCARLTAERDRLAARVAELEKEMARGMSVAFERERCAKIAEKHREELAHDEAVFTKERDRNSAHLLGECASVAADIAADIRAIAPKEPT